MHFCPNCKFMVYTKLENNILKNYCKNCNWIGDIPDANNAIYKRNYQEDFIADKVISNRYTIFDSTLPRVEYDCVNDNCATKIAIDKSKSLLITNIPADFKEEQLDLLLGPIMDKISKTYRIKLEHLLVTLLDEVDKNELINYFKSNRYVVSQEFTTPKREVLYIKYDNINMKYLYICSICGTSWKKN